MLLPDDTNHAPATTLAPVLLDNSAESVARLRSHLQLLENSDFESLSASESTRLAPYFSLMGGFMQQTLALRQALDATAEAEGPDHKAKRWNAMATPGYLSSLFCAMARHSRNILLSHPVIMAHETYDSNVPGMQFHADFHYAGQKIHFGFMRIHSWHPDGYRHGNIALPVLQLPLKMLARLPQAQAAKMMQELQAVMALVNHDPLHHFTSPLIVNAVAPGTGKNIAAMEKWGNKISHYEHWAQITQEHIIGKAVDTPQMTELYTRVDSYFHHLKQAGLALLGTANEGAAADDKRQLAHETTDFFGMVMGHVITRALPLHHPLFGHLCRRMQGADPAPDLLRIPKAADAYKAYEENTSGKEDMRFLREKKLHREVVFGYIDSRLDLLQEPQRQMSYRHFKLFQLIGMSPVDTAPHTPFLRADKIHKAQAKSGRRLLKMVDAAARVTGYFPAPAAPRK